MGADVLAMQGARASATMIFTVLNQINSVPRTLRIKGLKNMTYVFIHECLTLNA